MAGHLFTSESVTEGHPDKICDIVSDSVLDAILAQDPRARVACETLVKTGFVCVAGEITTTARIDVPSIVRKAINEIGYSDSAMGFDGNTCGILTAVEQQSPDIAQGVDDDKGLYKEQGAGDQGLMFGFAVDETKELMPMPIDLAHRLAHRLATVRKKGKVPFLRPDGKTQVTVEYEDGKPKRIDAVVVSTQHADGVKHKTIEHAIREEVIVPVLPKGMVDKNTKFFINPTGRFVVGGPCGDAGLTGRKIIVDSYGGMGRHGGGAFSGKDPSKVDRSAAYYARHVAKNIVASGVASRCEVQVAYAIGVARPMGVYVTTFGTGKVEDDRIAHVVADMFDFRPRALIDELELLAPRYVPTAAYGHFGRSEPTFTWERTHRAAELAEALLPKKTKAVEAPKAEKTAKAQKVSVVEAPAKKPKKEDEKKSKKDEGKKSKKG